MSISGNLMTMELAELLQWIAQGGKTGSLLIDNGKVRKRIYFVEGRIVASASTDPSEFLGHFLVSHGHITENELAKAMEMQATSKMLLGKILVTIGSIEEDDLQRLLLMKTEESVYDVFSWTEGEFRFVEDEKLATGHVPMALDVQALTLQGMNRVDEWKRIRSVIATADAVPVTVRDFDFEKMSPGEANICRLIDDDRCIREICMHSHASEFQVSQTLFQKQQEGYIKVVRARTITLQEVHHEDSVKSGTKSIPVVSSETLIESANKHLEQNNFSRALRHLRAARSLEPDSQEINDHLDVAERFIREKLSNEGLDLEAVPILNRSVGELTSMALSPEEGFALSRINGQYDIRSLIKISPMDTLDAQLVFYKLMVDGLISFQPNEMAS